MKKISMLAFLLFMGALMAGCSGETSKATDTGNSQSISTDGVNGEITVSCYDSALSQAFLDEAAQKFEEKYPGTKVTIDSFSEMPEMKSSEQDGEKIQVVMQKDDPQGRADYISKTSTSLMSGQGADLLAMDVLPIYKYVEFGQLENIRQYMDHDADFHRSDYRENILNALALQDGIWYLPINYSFDYYAYDSTLTGKEDNLKFGGDQAYSTSQLMELGKADFDGSNKIFPAPAYLQSGNGDMFSILFKDNYSTFVDLKNKKANFKDGSFQDMINGVKSSADDGTIGQAASETTDSSTLMNSMIEDPTERFFFKPKNQFALIQETYPDRTFRIGVSTSEVSNGIETDDQIAGICAEESGIIPFTYDQAFAMNANSRNKQTAWAFMKFLLSEEMQSSPNMSMLALPMHNKARKDRTENLYRMLFAEGGELNETQREGLDRYLNAVEALSNQINGYTYRDTTIQDMVIKEMKYFFDGTKSADQVCEVLQNKVDLYLNE